MFLNLVSHISKFGNNLGCFGDAELEKFHASANLCQAIWDIAGHNAMEYLNLETSVPKIRKFLEIGNSDVYGCVEHGERER